MSSAPAAPSKRSTRGQRAIIGAAIILFAVVSAYLALVIITRVSALFFPAHPLTLPNAVGKVLPGVQTDGSASRDPINILVMGLDRRPGEGTEPTRTDTIFVVHIDPKTNSTGILGFPRDMLVDIPGRSRQDRINTVYLEGELRDKNGGGIRLMKQVLAQDPFNIEIDKYILIDFKGFEKIIDDLGGIDVDVSSEVYDPYYSETELPSDFLPQHFYPGTQRMDGVTALAYSRIRFSSDDLDRIQRQQRVIFATIDKAKTFDVLNPKKATSLWSEYKDTVKTDISDFQIADYALTAAEVQDDIHAVSLGPAMVPYTDPVTLAQVLIGDTDLVTQIVDSVFSENPTGLVIAEATPEPVKVQVQNGSGVDGLGGRVLDYIASKGYPPNDLVPAANVWDGLNHTSTEIIDLDGTHEKNGFLLANWLGLKDTAYRRATTAELSALTTGGATIIVVLGSDVDFDTLIQSPTTSVPGG